MGRQIQDWLLLPHLEEGPVRALGKSQSFFKICPPPALFGDKSLQFGGHEQAVGGWSG
jgi:hypothetical protein